MVIGTMARATSKRWGESASAAGFTLLEVLIALAILSTAMTILMGTMANSSQQSIYANELTRVSTLARSKMVDIEYELMREGLTENIERMSGNFSDQEAPDVEWEAEIQPVEIPDAVKEELLGKVNAQLFGGTDSQGALKGNAAFSSKLPSLIGCMPQMINRIGQKVRRVILIVRFDFRGEEQTLRLTQYIVDKSSREFNLFGPAGDSSTETESTTLE